MVAAEGVAYGPARDRHHGFRRQKSVGWRVEDYDCSDYVFHLVPKDLAKRRRLYWEMKTALKHYQDRLAFMLLTGHDEQGVRYHMTYCRMYRDAVESSRNGRLPKVDPYNFRLSVPRTFEKYWGDAATWAYSKSHWNAKYNGMNRLNETKVLAARSGYHYPDVEMARHAVVSVVERELKSRSVLQRTTRMCRRLYRATVLKRRRKSA